MKSQTGGAKGFIFEPKKVLHNKMALGQQLSFQKTENKTRYPFAVLKPTQSSGFSRSVQQKRGKRAFRI